jgi:glycine oxidase
VGGDFPFLSKAAAGWPGLLSRVGAPGALSRSGAMFVGGEARVDALLRALSAVGAEPELLSGGQARALQPGLAQDAAAAVFVPGEARIAPEPLLGALRQAFVSAGGNMVADAFAGGSDAVVIAAGFGSAALARIAPELALLQPIKGQILALPGAAPERGPMVRGEGIYVCPQAGGAVAGATMEPGRSDLELDSATIRTLHRHASALFPALSGVRPIGRSGVRAATPDGLPLVGPSARAGVFLATGMRRNGWLLAPMVAELAAAAVLGEPAGPEAARFDPRRFG